MRDSINQLFEILLYRRSFETRPVEGYVIRAAPVTSDPHIAGQAAFEVENAPHEENFVSSRRKFCFIAMKQKSPPRQEETPPP